MDDHTVAWWGVGDDDEFMVPAIVLHDMETAAERVIFPGPFGDMPPGNSASLTKNEDQTYDRTGGSLYCDRWLWAWKPNRGLSAWDLADGSRVYHRPDICPAAYHPGKREFLFRHGNEWSALRFIAGFDP